MFDSLLDRSRITITLDRCINNNSPDKELLTDLKDVQNETARHFQRVVGSQYSNPSLLEVWKQVYTPDDSIDTTIYHFIMQLPSKEEWHTIIKALPNGKALGPSKISNEMLKNLGPFAAKCF